MLTEFSTNQNFWSCGCTPTSYTTGLASFELQTGISNKRPTGHMWPARVFRAARDYFWESSNDQHLSYAVYSPLFESAPTASEQFPLRTYSHLEIIGL